MNINQNIHFTRMSAFVHFIAALNFVFNWTLIYLLFSMSTAPISWTWNENRCFIFEIELTKIEGRISQVNSMGCLVTFRYCLFTKLKRWYQLCWNMFLFVEERILEISDSLVIMVDLAADTKRDDLSEFLK